MISVIICTFNRAGMLEQTLASLETVLSPSDQAWELVIVDNNSTDTTSDVIARFVKRSPVPVVAVRETRQGKSCALNRGVRESHGEVCAFTDDDVTFDAQWLRGLVAPFSNAEIAGVGGRIVPVWQTPVPSWFVRTGRYRLPAAIVEFELGAEPVELARAPYGANVAFRRNVFDRFGGFREDLGPSGGTLMRGEDGEFAERLLARGARLVYRPDAVVYHPVEPGRATKAYFRRWKYDGGRSQARQEGLPPGTKAWFGIPHYMIRRFGEGVLFRLLTAGRQRSFYWELQAYSSAGAIREYWRMRREARDAVART